LALAWPAVVGHVYVFDDLGAFHLPLRAFYARCLADGTSFGWLPQLYGGLYLTGEGQVGTYHPLHWLLYRLLPLERAFCAELLLGYLWMFAGTVGFLRRHLSWPAAVWGGLAFTFSGFNLLHLAHLNAIATVAHLPWLLWAIDVLLHSESQQGAARAAVWIALLTGSQLLLGYPQYVWFSLLAEGAYAGWMWWRRTPARRASDGTRVHGGPSLARRAGVSWLFVAKALGLMIGAVQLLPTADSLSNSVRQATGARFALSGSLDPLNAVQLVAPYLLRTRVMGENTHELGLYCGAVPLLLAAWWLTNPRLRDRTGIGRWSIALAALALLLALGGFGPLYRLQLWLPLVSKFRMPCRYIVLFHFAMALISGCAVGSLVARRKTSIRLPSRLWPVWAIAAISALAAVTAPWCFDRQRLADLDGIVIGPLVFTLAAGLMTMAVRKVRIALPLLALLTAADLGSYGLSYSVHRHTSTLDEFTDSAALPAELRHERVVFGLPSARFRNVAVGNAMLLAGASRLDGYVGLPPAKTLDYRHAAALRVAGVRWVRRNEETARIAGLRPHGCGWLKVPDPLPPIRLVTQAVTSREPAKDLPAILVDSTALVESPLDLPPGPPGSVQVLVNAPGEIQVETFTSTPQLLVVTESRHCGWQAEIDGQPAPVLRVNGDFFGCAVPAGSHRVCFAFRPASLRYGLSISVLGLGLTAALSAMSVFRHLLNRTSSRTRESSDSEV
jgi:hypothetical protein